MEEIRLNKFLAERLGISRRVADDLIAAGRVEVNGKVAVLGARIHENDKVVSEGKPVSTGEFNYTYLAFNKPVGYVCSRKKQGDADTIYSLLPEKFQDLKTVGRLDKDSSGLILLTNDGDFSFQMTHPKFVKTKTYVVVLDRALEPLHQQMISDFGVNLPDGISKLTLTSLADGHATDSIDQNGDYSRLRFLVEMSEGRNRQIRRTFEALGYMVRELHRISFGNYQLGDLKNGEFKEIQK